MGVFIYIREITPHHETLHILSGTFQTLQQERGKQKAYECVCHIAYMNVIGTLRVTLIIFTVLPLHTCDWTDYTFFIANKF